jgi:membrane fusion protein, multidrug efflux system
MRLQLKIVVPMVLVVAAAGIAWHLLRTPAQAVPNPGRTATLSAIPVTACRVEAKDVPVFLTGLGTVQGLHTVIVKVRVDGQLDKVTFIEGQDVKAGDVLAQIDPHPFLASLDQAKATLAKDRALLANAQLDLKRYVNLGSFATRQSVDTQRALIQQLDATIQNDRATIESAQVQLDYTTIRAPISGRTGIRLVDPGNIVHGTDANGLVVITQLQPIAVIFSLPADQLGDVNKAMARGPLKIIAYSRTGQRQLGEGTLMLVDNQIDQSTDTIRLKATFPNLDHALWPGQYIDARLLLQTLRHAVTVPSAAIQRGPDGMYVYVITPKSTVEMRPVGVGQMANGTAVIERGLQFGERVVVSGQYRLQAGSSVQAQLRTKALSEK